MTHTSHSSSGSGSGGIIICSSSVRGCSHAVVVEGVVTVTLVAVVVLAVAGGQLSSQVLSLLLLPEPGLLLSILPSLLL